MRLNSSPFGGLSFDHTPDPGNRTNRYKPDPCSNAPDCPRIRADGCPISHPSTARNPSTCPALLVPRRPATDNPPPATGHQTRAQTQATCNGYSSYRGHAFRGERIGGRTPITRMTPILLRSLIINPTGLTLKTIAIVTVHTGSTVPTRPAVCTPDAIDTRYGIGTLETIGTSVAIRTECTAFAVVAVGTFGAILTVGAMLALVTIVTTITSLATTTPSTSDATVTLLAILTSSTSRTGITFVTIHTSHLNPDNLQEPCYQSNRSYPQDRYILHSRCNPYSWCNPCTLYIRSNRHSPDSSGNPDKMNN